MCNSLTPDEAREDALWRHKMRQEGIIVGPGVVIITEKEQQHKYSHIYTWFKRLFK